MQPASASAPTRLRDLALAVALAAGLSLAWALGDWRQLRWLILPDTDDMARLAQVRDWLAGQRFDDWTQHRMGPPGGAPMHWSRINDLGLAALILAARPLLDAHAAELLAVIVYPAALFAAFIFLAARTARRLWHDDAAGPIAALLAALAYPANALFLPGRIDHHALQVVCLMAALHALAGAATRRGGIVAGVAIAVSLGIGLETLPAIAAVIGATGLLWVVDGRREARRIEGVASGLGAVTLLLLAAMRPSLWSSAYCDGFTPASTSATLGAAVLLLLLARTGATSWKMRLAAGAVGGGALLAGTLAAYPACIAGPYGVMDPFLRHAIIDNITEAMPLFGARPWLDSLAMGGVLASACVATGWALLRTRIAWRAALPAASVIAVSMLVTFAQVRGAYVGAAVAPLMLAGMVAAARRAGPWRSVPAWLAACGIAWLSVPPLIAAQVTPTARSASRASVAAGLQCRTGSALAAIDRVPAGLVMAPIDLSAYLLGATHHRIMGAGYHRNNIGHRILYAFFLADPGRARTIAAHSGVAYVALCPTSFAELDPAPSTLAARLRGGTPPAWLEPIPLRGTSLAFYRVR